MRTKIKKGFYYVQYFVRAYTCTVMLLEDQVIIIVSITVYDGKNKCY